MPEKQLVRWEAEAIKIGAEKFGQPRERLMAVKR
jgi:hypothetical protein